MYGKDFDVREGEGRDERGHSSTLNLTMLKVEGCGGRGGKGEEENGMGFDVREGLKGGLG